MDKRNPATVAGRADGESVPDPERATQQRTCPLCGADDYRVLMRRDVWRLVQCARCALVYLPEIPTPDAIETEFEWNDSFARTRAERWARNPVFRLLTLLALGLKPSRERRALRRIRRWAPPGRMLDVGCGDGRLAALAQRQGYDPVAVELSPKMAGKARRRLGAQRVLCGRLADFELEPESFDLVVTVSYLEHEPDPAGLVRRIYELLRPGGVCVHKVPNYASTLRKVLGRRWSGYRWPEHFQYFTPETLARLMADAGFEPLGTAALALSDNFWQALRKPHHEE